MTHPRVVGPSELDGGGPDAFKSNRQGFGHAGIAVDDEHQRR
jgi:hypothetical protein